MIYIISKEVINYENIKRKISGLPNGTELEFYHFTMPATFLDYYSAKVDKEPDDLLLSDVEIQADALRTYCETQDLMYIPQTNTTTWSAYLEQISDFLESIKEREKKERNQKEEEDGPESQTSVEPKEPIIIYKNAEPEIVEKIVEIEKVIEVPVYVGGKKGRFPFLSPSAPRQAVPEANNEGARTRLIGIVGAGYGVGATSLALQLARELRSKKVALLERNESKQLQLWDGIAKQKDKGLKDIAFYENQPLTSLHVKEYDYVIIDFGVYVEVKEAEAGCFYANKVLDDQTNIKKLELSFCDNVILVASPAPWRAAELIYHKTDATMSALTKNWIVYSPGAGGIESDQYMCITGNDGKPAYQTLLELIK